MTATTQLLKRKIRQQMKSLRVNYPTDAYLAANYKLQTEFWKLAIVNQAEIMLIYYSIQREVETVPLITGWLQMGRKVALPVCLPGNVLKAAIIQDLNDLVPGIFGLQEPGSAAAEVIPQDLDLIVVPGLAFDKSGYRLGYGAGYFDKFLANTGAFKLGLAYDYQIVEKLPIEPHDQPLNAILTPSHYFNFC